MSPEPAPLTFDRVVRVLISAVIVVGVLALLRYLADVLVPFAAAVVLAYLLNPLVSLFEEKTRRRGLAVAITVGGLSVIGLAVFALILPVAYSQVTRFVRDLDKLRADLAAAINEDPTPSASSSAGGEDQTRPEGDEAKSVVGWRELRQGWAEFRAQADRLDRSQRFVLLRNRLEGTYLGDLLDAGIRYVNSEDFRLFLISAGKRLVAGGWSVVVFVGSLVLGLTVLILTLLYMVFLLLDFPEYARNWRSFLPPRYREPIVEFLLEFERVLRRYFRGQFVVSVIYASLLAVGFGLIGLPMGVLLGLGIGLLSMIPYLQIVGLVPAALLAVMRSIETDASFLGSLLLTFGVFAGVQMLQDWLITPRIMGKATGLRPVVILLGVFIWGKLLGFLGLVLAIPLSCLAIAYYRRYVLKDDAHAASA
jgi:predicted PurR-regulated permease PerM